MQLLYPKAVVVDPPLTTHGEYEDRLSARCGRPLYGRRSRAWGDRRGAARGLHLLPYRRDRASPPGIPAQRVGVSRWRFLLAGRRQPRLDAPRRHRDLLRWPRDGRRIWQLQDLLGRDRAPRPGARCPPAATTRWLAPTTCIPMRRRRHSSTSSSGSRSTAQASSIRASCSGTMRYRPVARRTPEARSR